MLQWASIDSWICTALHCLPVLAFCQEPSQLWKSCTSPELNLSPAPLLFLRPSLLHSFLSSPCTAIFFMPESLRVFTDALALRVVVCQGWMECKRRRSGVEWRGMHVALQRSEIVCSLQPRNSNFGWLENFENLSGLLPQVVSNTFVFIGPDSEISFEDFCHHKWTLIKSNFRWLKLPQQRLFQESNPRCSGCFPNLTEHSFHWSDSTKDIELIVCGAKYAKVKSCRTCFFPRKKGQMSWNGYTWSWSQKPAITKSPSSSHFQMLHPFLFSLV